MYSDKLNIHIYHSEQRHEKTYLRTLVTSDDRDVQVY